MKALLWLLCLSTVVFAQDSFSSDSRTSKIIVLVSSKVPLGEYMVNFDVYNKFAVDEVEGIPSYSVYFSNFGVDASGTLHIQQSISSAYNPELNTTNNFFVDINDMPILFSTGARPGNHPDVEVHIRETEKGYVGVDFMNSGDFEPHNNE